MDYHKLLQKYMRHVLEEESVTYTEYLGFEPSRFTDEEIVELKRIAEQVQKDRDYAYTERVLSA